MSTRVVDVVAAMEAWAPAAYAANWDRAGLQFGSPGQPAHHILVALEVSEPLVSEAVDVGADCLVVHHPPLFRALSEVRLDRPHGAMLARLIRGGIAVYAAHTALDVAPDGTADVLAAAAGLAPPYAVLRETVRRTRFKLVTFVPPADLEAVHRAMADAGAGVIGRYHECSFRVDGTATFRPGAGARPYAGEEGALQQLEEVRLEMIVPEARLQAVVEALKACHPYETVAYDVYTVQGSEPLGFGRIGRLEDAVTLQELAADLEVRLAESTLRYLGKSERRVETVAVMPGSAGDFVADAAAAGADVLIGADFDYHDGQRAWELGLALIDAGHGATERIVVATVVEQLSSALATHEPPPRIRAAVAGRSGPWDGWLRPGAERGARNGEFGPGS